VTNHSLRHAQALNVFAAVAAALNTASFTQRLTPLELRRVVRRAVHHRVIIADTRSLITIHPIGSDPHIYIELDLTSGVIALFVDGGVLTRQFSPWLPLQSATLVAPRRSKNTTKNLPSGPPECFVYLLYLALPRDKQEFIIGDLEERFPTFVARFGERRARWWFYRQGAGAVGRMVPGRIAALFSVRWLIDLLFRLIGR
jgi:hypothetical protein